MASAARRSAGDPRLRALVTPEGVSLTLSLADLGERFGALVIDLLVLLGTFTALTLGLLGVDALIGGQFAGRAALVLWLLGGFLLRNFYFAWLESGPRGATLGKRALKIRVVARHGGRLTLDSVIARNAMREVELYMPLSFLMARIAEDGPAGWLALAGFGWIGILLALPLFNRDRLRAGDLLAGTWVIRSPRHVLLPELADDPMDSGSFTAVELTAYGAHELHILAEVLRAAIPDDVSTVAEAIRLRLNRRWQPAQYEPDLAFLKSYYHALRGHLEADLLRGIRRRDKNVVR